MDEQEAFRSIIQYLKIEDPEIKGTECDITTPKAALKYVKDYGNIIPKDSVRDDHPQVKEKLSYFQDAIAGLCRMGVLRAGPQGYSQNILAVGKDFSLTKQGREWIKNSEIGILLYSPHHFSKILSEFDSLFGEGYRQRSQEACTCYLMGCFFAACAMSGAAAESILLHLAIKKGMAEEDVVKNYRSSQGTKKLTDYLVGQLHPNDKEKFNALSELIKYHRNASAHGEHKNIVEFHAYDSLSRLIHFCYYVRDNLISIIGNN